MLVFAGTKHQSLDCFAWVLAFIEDQLHLLGNRHFNAMMPCKAQCGAGGQNALRHFAAEALQNLR